MLTKAQKAHLEKISPSVARRWDSRGIPPKTRSDATDFKPLSPGPKARHPISFATKEQDSMENGPVEFQPGSRGNRLDQFKRK